MRKPFADIRNEAILSAMATFDIEPKSVTEHTQWRRERHRVPVAVVDGKVVGRASLTRSEWQQGCHARGILLHAFRPVWTGRHRRGRLRSRRLSDAARSRELWLAHGHRG